MYINLFCVGIYCLILVKILSIGIEVLHSYLHMKFTISGHLVLQYDPYWGHDNIPYNIK